MINIQKMMQQAQQVQQKLQEVQEKIKDIDVSGVSGGGLVKVVMSCAGVVRSIKIDPSVLGAGNQEMLEDLVIAAVNNAGEAKDERIKDETRIMLESMGLPGDTQVPF